MSANDLIAAAPASAGAGHTLRAAARGCCSGLASLAPCAPRSSSWCGTDACLASDSAASELADEPTSSISSGRRSMPAWLIHNTRTPAGTSATAR
eukprot:scaffold30432_cov60-Phaeocystis_antarctica.AAC.1